MHKNMKLEAKICLLVWIKIITILRKINQIVNFLLSTTAVPCTIQYTLNKEKESEIPILIFTGVKTLYILSSSCNENILQF